MPFVSGWAEEKVQIHLIQGGQALGSLSRDIIGQKNMGGKQNTIQKLCNCNKTLFQVVKYGASFLLCMFFLLFFLLNGMVTKESTYETAVQVFF